MGQYIDQIESLRETYPERDVIRSRIIHWGYKEDEAELDRDLDTVFNKKT